eukprot:3170248-Rhodomonas_salina.1
MAVMLTQQWRWVAGNNGGVVLTQQWRGGIGNNGGVVLTQQWRRAQLMLGVVRALYSSLKQVLALDPRP